MNDCVAHCPSGFIERDLFCHRIVAELRRIHESLLVAIMFGISLGFPAVMLSRSDRRTG